MPSTLIQNWDQIVLIIISVVLGVLLGEPLKKLLSVISVQLKTMFVSLGLGFQKRYYNVLIVEHHRMKTIGTYSRNIQPPRLKEVYIPLQMSIAEKEDNPPITWEHIFDSNEKRIVILGKPGSGKSTFLDYLILIFIGHIRNSLRAKLNSRIPMYARLKDLVLPDSPKTILGLLEWTRNIKLEKIPNGYFEHRLRKGKCIVLLDGLDEILNRNEQDTVVAKIKSFVNEYSRFGNWIIVTCRSAGWEKQLPDFRAFTVRDFNIDDVHKFIGAWYREVLRSQKLADLPEKIELEQERMIERESYEESISLASGLWEDLHKKEDLLRLARTPLILSLVMLVYKNSTKLPKSRAKLYEACLDILLDKWDSEVHRLSIPHSPTIKGKLLILRAIAFYFLENNLIQIERRELENLITPLLPQLGVPVSEMELIRQIYERSGVLEEKRVGIFEFAHRALQDYLAASYIAEYSKETLLLEHASEEPWREVILITIGLVEPKKATELIKILLNESGQNPASLALAGWSLGEDIQIEKEELRVQIAERVRIALDTVETSSDFRILTDSLQTASPSSLSDWLRNAIISRDPILRLRALKYLPDLGVEQGKTFISILVNMVGDKKVEKKSRAMAIYALTQLRPESDALLWQTLAEARHDSDRYIRSQATWAYCELGHYEDLGLVKVPAGEFLVGSSDLDSLANQNEKPQHTIYLPTYFIGKSPVSFAAYRAFIKDSRSDVNQDLDQNDIADHPVRFVSWYEALAYAEWHGMTLPSEAEWEKAARGTDGRIYPWGNEWFDEYANIDKHGKVPRNWWVRFRFSGQESTTTPIGYFSPRSDSPYGCTDMSGNVWEWTRSIFDKYPYTINENRERLDSKDDRVLRGGSFFDSQVDARCAKRNAYNPSDPLDRFNGFRVAVQSIKPDF